MTNPDTEDICAGCGRPAPSEWCWEGRPVSDCPVQPRRREHRALWIGGWDWAHPMDPPKPVGFATADGVQQFIAAARRSGHAAIPESDAGKVYSAWAADAGTAVNSLKRIWADGLINLMRGLEPPTVGQVPPTDEELRELGLTRQEYDALP